jgi:hypothetical protein
MGTTNQTQVMFFSEKSKYGFIGIKKRSIKQGHLVSRCIIEHGQGDTMVHRGSLLDSPTILSISIFGGTPKLRLPYKSRGYKHLRNR